MDYDCLSSKSSFLSFHPEKRKINPLEYFANIKNNIGKAIKNPRKAFNYAGRMLKQIIPNIVYNYYYILCPKPKRKVSAINTGVLIENEIISKLNDDNYNLLDLYIDEDDYREYVDQAGYNKFPNYYGGGTSSEFFNKSLQHYLAAKLLNLSHEDVYGDIACSVSPATDIYQEMYRCKTYRQDLGAPEGIHGDTIGGDAGNMPVEDGFFTKMGLHCSFEHFEQDSDINFIKEAGRVLKKGGKLCIIPLYLSDEYTMLSNPAYMVKSNTPIEEGAILYCQKRLGQGYARFYDVPHLTTRVKNNLNGLKLTIYVIQNGKDVDPSCWVRFVALFEKD